MNIEQICGLLNAYMFNNVWNGPYTNFKKTVPLNRLFKRYSVSSKHSVTGGFQSPSHYIKLPNMNEPYYIYYIDKSLLDSSMLGVTAEWKSLDELSNNRYSLTVINDGYTLSRCKVFLYQYTPSDDVFVAVSMKMAFKISSSFNADYCDMIIRNDWDDIDTSTCFSKYVEVASDRVAVWTRCQNPYTELFINGQLQSEFDYNNIQIGDYVDVVLDLRKDIEFEIDMSTDEGKNLYLSSEDDKLYAVCHVPKNLNVMNKILNCSDVEIYASSIHSGFPEGLLVHSRVLELKQITHNDFAIPDDLLIALGAIIGSQELKLKIKIRRFHRSFLLSRDQNYIDLLYKHTDDEIIHFLTNTYVLNIDFWTADHLAQSNYVKFISSQPSFINRNNISTYIETFGYQYVLSLLSDTVRKFIWTDKIEYPLVIKRPCLFSNAPIVLFFRNQLKIHQDNLTINYSGSDYISAGITDVTLNDGDECIIELLETTQLSHVRFSPTALVDRIELTSGNYEIYRRESFTDAVRGVNTSYNRKYTPVTSGVVKTFSGGVYRYVFASSTFGREYIFVPTEGSYVISKTYTPADELIPLYVDLTTSVLGSSILVPYLGVRTTKVFLNQKSLVENVDYRFITHLKDNVPCGTQIVIYNANYSGEENVIEVVISRNLSNKYNSFLRSTADHLIENSYIWFDSIGTISVDGRQVLNAFNTNMGLYIDHVHRAGALVESTVIYPTQTKEFVTLYQSQQADAREHLLTEYFNSIDPPSTDLVTIPYAHNLYSIKVCQIIHDIMTGQLQLAVEPNINKLIQSDLVDYQYLDSLDILGTPIDKMFIDFQIAYRNVLLASPDIYTLVDHVAHAIIDDSLNYGGIE